VIAETGSFTLAAKALGLSQPAISSHIKRLQQIVAGEIFSRVGMRPQLTPFGQIVVDHARRAIAVNDKLLSLASSHPEKPQLRLGIPNGIATRLLGELIANLDNGTDEVTFHNYNADQLVRGLDAGYIDIAFVPYPESQPPVLAVEWLEPLYWVTGPAFRLSPDGPIPLVSWPGSLSDRIAVAALKRAGIPYTNAFISAALGARMAACLAGRGIMVAAERAFSDGIVILQHARLPQLAAIPAGIYAREGLDLKKADWAVRILESYVRPAEKRQKPPAVARVR
jgi:DNA-binding transcriptional LysR family regulator